MRPVNDQRLFAIRNLNFLLFVMRVLLKQTEIIIKVDMINKVIHGFGSVLSPVEVFDLGVVEDFELEVYLITKLTVLLSPELRRTVVPEDEATV